MTQGHQNALGETGLAVASWRARCDASQIGSDGGDGSRVCDRDHMHCYLVAVGWGKAVFQACVDEECNVNKTDHEVLDDASWWMHPWLLACPSLITN